MKNSEQKKETNIHRQKTVNRKQKTDILTAESAEKRLKDSKILRFAHRYSQIA